MSKRFKSIFQRKQISSVEAPEREKPIMRVLEPRVLLDAAAVETAIDVAGQAAHSQLADDYMANSRPANDLAPEELQEDMAADEGEDGMDMADVAPRRTDREIVFIDAGVEDRESLIASLELDANIVILESDRDGLQQIADAMAGDEKYNAIHIFAHGTAGQLQLGDSVLNAATMAAGYKEILGDIGEQLNEEADILIYGCDFGQGRQGELAARLLASATGADIAASDDLTGSESLAGDWDLEFRVGEVTARSYTLPQWSGILAGYELQANTDPVISHSSNGIVGTVGTQALWSNAVTYDPGGGAPIQVFDIRASFIGASGQATATFETVSTTNPTLDDVRVVVTNVGNVERTVAGQDVLEEGSVTVLWEVLVAGTTTRAPANEINLTLLDLDGLAGQVDTVKSVEIGLANLNSYTLANNTDLVTTNDEFTLAFDGTQAGTNDPASQVSAYWAASNQFILIYSSNTQTAEFVMDGDGDFTFAGPSTEFPTQSFDLDSDDSDAIGDDFSITYLDGLPAGPVSDSPVILGDVDLSIFDLNNSMLQSVTVTLTNAFSGDVLGYDSNVLSDLDITTSLDTSVPGEITLNLYGAALISNFETALKTVSYQNTDANFNTTEDRIVTFEISDGIISTSGAQTVVSFGTVSSLPVASPNVYVQDEDTTLTASVATGLLSNDADAQGDTLTIVSARDSSGAAIAPLGSPHTTPNGAILTLNSDGSFTYIPAEHFSGAEDIEYTISDGTFQSSGWATFDIQPVVDSVDLQITQTNPVSSEDDPTNPVSIVMTSPDASETQEVWAQNIPLGVTLTDGVNTFLSDEAGDSVDVTNWNLNQIRILPLQNSDLDVVITFEAFTIEADDSSNVDSQDVTFQIDAVADSPIVTIPSVSAPIDADVNIGVVMNIDLFDDDGSESITQVRLTNLPAGSQILVNGSVVPTPGNMVDLQIADLDDLVFRPPQTGINSIYTIGVTVTVSETGAENGIALPTFIRGPIDLVVDLNADDDPVFANVDSFSTSAGVPVVMNLLSNDSIPDGGGEVIEINGTAINSTSPVTLPGGVGVVSKNVVGDMIFTPESGYSGIATFNYTVRDADISTDVAEVQVTVQPTWNLTGDVNATEGTDAAYQITLGGALRPGETATVDLSVVEGTATALDYTSLTAAVNTSIAGNTDQGFSFDGTTLSYSAPRADYDVAYDSTGSTYAAYDISATGFDLGLGDDGISARPLGFEFEFYGVTVDTAYISANGYVTFGSPVDISSNQTLDGSAFGGRPAIAALWDDLRAGSGSVLYQATADAFGNGLTVIQWQDVEHESGGGGTANFQMIISERDGSVRVNYDEVGLGGGFSNGGSATVGVEGPGGMFTQYLVNGSAPLASGSSIVFDPQPVLSPTLDLDFTIINDPHFEVDETFELTLSASTGSTLGAASIETTIGSNDNSDPTVVDDAVTTGEITPVTFNVLSDAPGADSDSDGHSLAVSEVNGTTISDGQVVSFASGARVTVFFDGTMTFDQNGAFDHLLIGQNATETFTYTAHDGFGGTSIATVVVTINGENRAPTIDLEDDGTNPVRDNSVAFNPMEPAIPVTAPDALIFDADDTSFVSLQIDLAGFLQAGEEIVDILGQQLVFGTARNTTVTVNGVVHDISYNGSDQILITVSAGEIATANMQELVRGVSYQNTSGVDIAGTRSLTFLIDDGDDVSTATADVLVTGFNMAPVAQDDGTPTPLSLVEDTSITISAATLLVNDSDPEGDPLHISSVQNAPNGSVIIDGSGDIVFTPDANFFGTTSFEYTLNDGRAGLDTGQVFLVVTGTPDAPQLDLNGAAAGTTRVFTYTENDTPMSIASADMSVQDFDAAGIDSASITISSGRVGDFFNVGSLPGGIQATTIPSAASSGLTSDSPVTITLTNTASAADYEAAIRGITFGSISEDPSVVTRVINVSVDAGTLTSNVAQTLIIVASVNDNPVANDDGIISSPEDQILRIDATTLLGNDTDLDGDTIVLDSVAGATNGSVTIDGSGRAVFTPDANYFGPASFTYTVNDGNGATDTAAVNLMITSVNDLTQLDLDAGTVGQSFQTNYTENDPEIAIVDASVSISDADDTNLQSAQVVLGNGAVGDRLSVAGLPAGIIATIVPSGHLTTDGPITLTLTGSATLADYEAALQAIRYVSSSESPTSGTRSINITVNDGEDDSAIAEARIVVTAVNDIPVAVDDNAFTVNEDTTLVLARSAIVANDTDLDGDTLTIANVTNASVGSISINGSGDVVFVPPAEYSGPASFDYEISDGNGGTDTGTVNVTVISVNDAPTTDLNGVGIPGFGYATSYIENAAGVSIVSTVISLTDVDDTNLEGASAVLNNGQVGDILEAPASVGPVNIAISPNGALASSGTITVTLSGTATMNEYEAALQAITYRSSSDAPSAVDRDISVLVNDGEVDSALATTTIAVVPVNDLPVANDDGSFNVTEDTTLVLGIASLVSNDVDLDGDTLTITNVSNAANGTVSINGSGDVEFVPNAEYSGPASFRYTVSDGNGGTDTADVTINVLAVNDAPVANLNGVGVPGLGYTTSYTENAAGEPIVSALVSLTDVDDTNLESAVAVLNNGQIGDIIEAPASVGPVSISVSPGGALTSTGSITVTLSGTATKNEYEAALQAITYRSVSDAPSAVDRDISVAINDGDLDSLVATTTITVIPVNDVPVANDDGSFNATEDTTLILGVASLIGNDVDLDGDTLTITGVTSAVNGTVSINGAGDVEFVPDPEYSGPASFRYTVTDGNGGNDTADVTINVVAVNDAPVADLNGVSVPGSGYTTSYTENAAGEPIVSTIVSLTDVDDTNLEGATAILNNGQVGDIIEAPANVGPVAISVSPSGALTANGFITVTLSGTATRNEYEAALRAVTYRSVSDAPSAVDRDISVTVNDGDVDSVVTTTTITVTPVNDIPVANDDGSFNATEDTTLVLGLASLLGNDTDLDGDTLTITGVANAVNGTISINGSGDIEFVPDADYAGPASFDYTIADGNGGSDTATVTIDILAVNDVPTADLNGVGVPGFDYVTTYTENAAGESIVSNIVSLTDVDDTDLEGATAILNNGQVGDIIEAPANVGPVNIIVSPGGELLSHGTITVTLSGTATKNQYEAALQAITYRSASDAPSAIDRDISVIINDGDVDSAVATTTITVVPVNDAPVAADDLGLSMMEDGVLVISPLTNDVDVEGDIISIVEIAGQPITPGGSVLIVHGQVDLSSDGRELTFTPSPDFSGLVDIDYAISDGSLTDTATISIDVIGVNDAPIARDDGPVVVAEDTSVRFDPIAGNDTDPEGDLLNVVAINGTAIAAGMTVSVADGSIELDADGRTLVFTPAPNFNGTTTVDYTISDSDLTSTAEIVFEVTPVNDPVASVSTPPDLNLEDGQGVSRPMASHFTDVDGDAMIFVATGLPAGLSIDATTGIVSGAIGSSASQSSPYAVTIEASDGMSAPAAVTFTMDITNPVPVGSADTSNLLDEGSTFAQDMSVLFNDPDGDVMTFTATGLPSWATINSLTGIVSGTVPGMAELAGPVSIVVHADDGQGGTASSNVTLDPRNVAPIVATPAADALVLEEQAFALDVSQHFADGGSDTDALSFTVSGLPGGLSFDPATGLISGTTSTGSSSPTPYEVVMIANDGQGGIVQDIFLIRIGDFSSPQEDDLPINDGDDSVGNDDPLDTSAGNDDETISIVEEDESLSGTAVLDGESGILIGAVSNADSLFGTTSSGADGGIRIGDISSIDQSGGWISSEGRSGTDDWLENAADPEVLSVKAMVDKIDVETYWKGDGFFILVKSTFPQTLELRVEGTRVTLAGGFDLPDWMKLIREGFISANPPKDLDTIDLEVTTILADGRELLKQVRIDIKTATVQPLEPELRGSLGVETKVGDKMKPSSDTETRS